MHEQNDTMEFPRACAPYDLCSTQGWRTTAGGHRCQAFFYLSIPLTYRYIFDDEIAARDMWLLGIRLLIQIGLFPLFGAAGVAHDWASARIGSSSATNLRQMLFGHLQAQGPGFYSCVNEGDVVASFGPDVAAVETAMVRAFPSFIMRSMNITLSTELLFLIARRLARKPSLPPPPEHQAHRHAMPPGTADTDPVSLSAAICRRSSAVHRCLVSATTSKLFKAMSRHSTGISSADALIHSTTSLQQPCIIPYKAAEAGRLRYKA
ncbi:hypothetical protein [Aestuariivirga sp.]|jgi:ABC-type multidrug transport system fused ATPase/permease subunit|uniref:hypothetical protein n=1 Tax=Aestuariivirga sp. TaxID=2650926 RepID=UPI003783DD24